MTPPGTFPKKILDIKNTLASFLHRYWLLCVFHLHHLNTYQILIMMNKNWIGQIIGKKGNFFLLRIVEIFWTHATQVEKHDDIDLEEWLAGFYIMLKGSRVPLLNIWNNWTKLVKPHLNCRRRHLGIARRGMPYISKTDEFSQKFQTAIFFISLWAWRNLPVHRLGICPT